MSSSTIIRTRFVWLPQVLFIISAPQSSNHLAIVTVLNFGVSFGVQINQGVALSSSEIVSASSTSGLVNRLQDLDMPFCSSTTKSEAHTPNLIHALKRFGIHSHRLHSGLRESSHPIESERRSLRSSPAEIVTSAKPEPI